MSIDRAEELKRELTDKYVIVAERVPELRRFAGKTGTVKTVNMNCRALVQFDSPEDIAWYDIDPAYLTVVEAPVKKEPGTAEATAAAAEKAVPKVAGKPAGGKNPLEAARAQGAAKPAAAGAGGAKPSPLELARQQAAARTAAPAEGEKKLSPLEKARQQGAAKAGNGETPAPPQPVATPADAPKPAAGKKLSPLELARQQGAAKPNPS